MELSDIVIFFRNCKDRYFSAKLSPIFRILRLDRTDVKKTLYKIGGYTAVGLGFAGAFLPLLPTTPFLLLAVWCFSRSYPELNEWLLSNKHFGRYLENYGKRLGVPVFVKTCAIITMCSVIAFTAIIFIGQTWLRILLSVIAVAVSVHIVLLKTYRDEQ